MGNLRDIISASRCDSFMFTQSDINKFFSASRDFRGGDGGSAKSRRGGGGG